MCLCTRCLYAPFAVCVGVTACVRGSCVLCSGVEWSALCSFRVQFYNAFSPYNLCNRVRSFFSPFLSVCMQITICALRTHMPPHTHIIGCLVFLMYDTSFSPSPAEAVHSAAAEEAIYLPYTKIEYNKYGDAFVLCTAILKLNMT